MAEQQQKETFIEPTNYTDPVVWHDPVIEKSGITKLYEPENAEGGKVEEGTNVSGNHKDFDTTKVDAIYHPIIQVNSRVLDNNNIKSMTIFYDDFFPTISLVVRDYSKYIQATNITQMNNEIKVIMISAVDGTYKPITLRFYIYDSFISGETVTFYASYKFLPFYKEHLKQIVFPGCSKCNMQEKRQPTTWEYLHKIALETGLGFASTDKCKDIEDRLPRIIQSRRYHEFIMDQIRFGGLDENSIFDVWVDLYGYITMVNLSWIFSQEINYKQLSIIAILGVLTTSNNTPQPKGEKVFRTITNYNMMGYPTNMEIESYDTKVNNDVVWKGTLTKYKGFSPRGVRDGASNNYANEDIIIQQNSGDGSFLEEYESEYTYVNIEPNAILTNKQKIYRDSFLAKHRERYLIVKLKTYNLGFQRGTLINVAIFEADGKIKHKLLTSSTNVEGPNEKIEFDDNDKKKEILNVVENASIMVPNESLSGIYYIDGMKFEYNYSIGKIEQSLILIKKGNLDGIDNLHTYSRLSK